MNSFFKCLYCGDEKQQSESSLEHAIPQFMGGEFAPKIFQLMNVCKKCNNNLGLWVDASYAKSWFVTNYMAEAATLLCTGINDPGLPLRYMGKAQITDINFSDKDIAEHWIGPSGETITWIRPHDGRMDCYAGGNPTDTKKKQSVAYFFPVLENEEKFFLGIKSFHQALKKRKVRKILCANLLNADGDIIDPKHLGFDVPNPEDLENKSIILKAINSGEMIHLKAAFDTNFDKRFICKLMLGIGYALFGQDFLNQPIVAEAQKGIWPRLDEEKSTIRGASTISFIGKSSSFGKSIGYPGAIAITVIQTNKLWSLCLSINENIPFVIELGTSDMTSQYVSSTDGYALLLFPYVEKSIELTMVELLSHKHQVAKNSKLDEIDQIIEKARKFNVKLANEI